MPDLPWTSSRTPEHDGEYLVLLTYLPLRRFRTLPAFFRLTLAVQRQLAGTAGLVGYTLRARPFSRRFWTLSVWDSEDALKRFVVAQPHRDTMRRLGGKMGETYFTRWPLRGSDLPPSWEDAMRRGAGD
jgi:heme-degrading monooxygenase HmoA